MVKSRWHRAVSDPQLGDRLEFVLLGEQAWPTERAPNTAAARQLDGISANGRLLHAGAAPSNPEFPVSPRLRREV